ncbi:hypothetical protein [Actinomadura sp. SCN-SB]|uniref:hypothetical protein n=1 Tax=Actinomadura sp. SCN-SB TaxID=3373092 RepID=UPI00375303D1
MRDRQEGRNGAAGSREGAQSQESSVWETLGGLESPPTPSGAASTLVNRMMVYLRPGQNLDKLHAVLPHVDTGRSGLVLSGANAGKAMRFLCDIGFDAPVLMDPACYDDRGKYTATCEAPFQIPDGRIEGSSLEDLLDEQLRMGASAALTPTGYIPGGGIDILKAAARIARDLRKEAIFVVPLDASLLARDRFRRTAAVLEDVARPIALILGGQFDPLDQSKQIIPNLRSLAATVPLMAIRTDFNAFDLLAHGAFAGAIGTGGSVRHTVDPAEKPRSYHRRGQEQDQSPSVLVPELACWLRGSKINSFFGARPTIVPRCDCRVCRGQRLSRFLRREHQNEAIAHAVAVWSRWACDMLQAPSMRRRAEYWRNLCQGALDAHTVFLQQMRRMDGLEPQSALKIWASLPAWPVELGSAKV